MDHTAQPAKRLATFCKVSVSFVVLVFSILFYCPLAVLLTGARCYVHSLTRLRPSRRIVQAAKNTSHSRSSYNCSKTHGSFGLNSLQGIAGAFLQEPQPRAGSSAHGTATRRGCPATGWPSSSAGTGCPTWRCRVVGRLRSGRGVRACSGQRSWSVLPFHTSLRVHRQAWAQDTTGRQGLYEAIQTSYAAVFPEDHPCAGGATFGKVVQEGHPASGMACLRNLHNHAVCAFPQNHRWKAIEKHLREEQGVKVKA